MMRLWLILPVLLFFQYCDEPKEGEDEVEEQYDTISPTLQLSDFPDNAVLSGTFTISLQVQDEKALKLLTILIDNAVFITDSTISGKTNLFVSYDLNTKTLSNSSHAIQISVTDSSDNVVTKNVSFYVDNSSKFITYLNETTAWNGIPPEKSGYFFTEEQDGYILYVLESVDQSDPFSPYTRRIITYSLNENGEIQNQIDQCDELLTPDLMYERPIVTSTSSGVYIVVDTEMKRFNRDGTFDASYSIDYNFDWSTDEVTGWGFNFGGGKPKILSTDFGWIKLNSQNGHMLSFNYIYLDEANVTTKEISYPGGNWGNLDFDYISLIASPSDSNFIISDMEQVTSENFRLMYLDGTDPTQSFIDSLSGLSPSTYFSPNLYIYNPLNRSIENADGYFIINAAGGGVDGGLINLMRFEGGSFQHIWRNEIDGEQFTSHIIRQNDIINFGEADYSNDPGRISRYDIATGNRLSSVDVQYDGVNDMFFFLYQPPFIIEFSDGGIGLSNSIHYGKFILKMDSDLNLPNI